MTGCGCVIAQHRHGTNRNYAVHRCRCFPCRVAHANAQRVYRAGGTWREGDWAPSIGVNRRLQALAAIGLSASDLAPRLGMTATYVAKLRTDTNHPLIRRSTFDLVCRVYDELWDKPRLDGNGRRTATQATTAGYRPPMAWDDDSIDEPTTTPGKGDSGWDLKPCGTTAAARRHQRRGEPLCTACRNAVRRAKDQRKAAA